MSHRTNDHAHPSRRAALRAGTLAAATLAGFPLSPAHAAPVDGTSVTFPSVPIARTDDVTVPPGYTAHVIAPWGAPLHSFGPRWRPDAANPAAEARLQIGTGHSGLHFLPVSPRRDGTRSGVLVINHASADPVLLHADGGRAATAERTAKEMVSLGASVVRVKLSNGRWRMVGADVNRRITASSHVTFSGPLYGHDVLEGGSGARGVLGGTAHAITPWGTYLTGEDTVSDVFGTRERSWRPSEAHRRYGLAADGSAYDWHLHRPRFDLAESPDEPYRFGWTVEISPWNPVSPPVKRTALGRIAHSGAAVTESRGRAVVYMSDTSHVYKFVGEHAWQEVRTATVSPLDEGTLFAARFDDDGTGEWIRLEHGRDGLTRRRGFHDQADVLLRAREAADAVGATELRSPGRPTVHPETGEVYLPEARAGSGGRVLVWTEGSGDHGATVLDWREFVRPNSSDDSDGARFAAPSGVYCGGDGRLWITTDVVRLGDDDQRADLGNSALLCADPETGRVRRFLTGPRGCGISGVTTAPDQRTLFVSVRGPGWSGSPLGDPTAADPRAVSNWPEHARRGRPRSAVVVVRREDGGVVGT
ncbi:PhoX family phosphatase [Nocardiopsis sp. FIRDI 009]|uniref:PhoX family protein n=1 Tax=Nocardiopsis sp. FIRDI 009 TaxID=714197 RepID=UPI000E2885D7|nr:alkaline phosphatase PhoX [Nocardiopsis sp. FIRDI 009]